MHTHIMAQLTLILPELLVAVGALVLLIVGVYVGKRAYITVTGLTIAVLIATIGALILFPREGSIAGSAMIIDPFACFMKVLMLIGAVVSLILSIGSAKAEKFDKFEFPVLVLLAVVGMMIMISAGNTLSLYLGLELQSLSLYVLAAINRDNARSTEAGLKYFVLGALSSGMLLYGISLIYGFTGQIEFQEIARVFKDASAASGGANGQLIGIVFGMVFVLAGLAFKISAVPFHMWTPDVYEGAPTPITTFFASAPKVAAMALIIRIVVDAFTPFSLNGNSMAAWQQIVIFISLASMILGAFAAIGQSNIKRLMAYSSISHMGYALVGLAALAPLQSGLKAEALFHMQANAVASVMTYMTIYMVMTLGCFAFILGMRTREGNVENIYDLAGLSKTNPFMAVMMTIQLFSLASIPPLAGFFAKWATFSAAVHSGLIALAVVGMVASVIAAFYYLRMIKIMWFDEPNKGGFLALPLEIKAVMGISGLLVLLYVFYGFWLNAGVTNVAATLIRAANL